MTTLKLRLAIIGAAALLVVPITSAQAQTNLQGLNATPDTPATFLASGMKSGCMPMTTATAMPPITDQFTAQNLAPNSITANNSPGPVLKEAGVTVDNNLGAAFKQQSSGTITGPSIQAGSTGGAIGTVDDKVQTTKSAALGDGTGANGTKATDSPAGVQTTKSDGFVDSDQKLAATGTGITTTGSGLN